MHAFIRRLIPGVVMALAIGLCSQARADIFTYNLVAGPGTSGGISGFFSIEGNTGDPFTLDPFFDGITNFDLQYNSSVDPFSFDLNPFDSFPLAGDPITFAGNLGDSILTPQDSSDGFLLVLEPIDFPFGFAIELDTDPTGWIAGVFPEEPFDGGDGWDLELASVSTAPLPSGLQMGLAGMVLLATAVTWRTLRPRPSLFSPR